MAIKLGINGFGRIGRTVLRIAAERPEEFEICGINLRKAEPEYMVYLMKYRIDKRQNRNGAIKWDVELSVKTQSVHWQSAVILERREKTFSSEESAQKYIDGKIKAYDYLFAEISPVIPDIDKSHFCVNGVLLPGYTTVSMQKEKEKKPSIRKQLNELKADKPTEQKQLKTRTKEVSI